MVARRYHHRAEDVVGADIFGGFAVDVGAPVGGVVHLAEDSQLVGGSMTVVLHIVSLVGYLMLHLDGGSGVNAECRAQGFELMGVDDCCRRGVEVVERQNLLVGILHLFDVADKPAVAQRLGVPLYLLVLHHDITCVEHVQHSHVDMATQVEVDDILVTAQFRRVVTANLVVERRRS